MPNQLSGQTGPSPRDHTKYQRYSKFARRVPKAKQFTAFLTLIAGQASTTTAAVFASLSGFVSGTNVKESAQYLRGQESDNPAD